MQEIVISGCELSKEKPTAKFEIEADDDDEDFLCHTLFLKQVNYIGLPYYGRAYAAVLRLSVTSLTFDTPCHCHFLLLCRMHRLATIHSVQTATDAALYQ